MKRLHPTPEMWYHRLWLPLCGFVYLTICICDFILFPIATNIHNQIIENRIITELKTNPTGATSFADAYEKSTQFKQWNPLTLLGGGLFHLAFGALLTGGAVTRGMQKKSEVEGYYGSLSVNGNGNNNGNGDEDLPTPKPPKV